LSFYLSFFYSSALIQVSTSLAHVTACNTCARGS
jgi:hypothetical protein